MYTRMFTIITNIYFLKYRVKACASLRLWKLYNGLLSDKDNGGRGDSIFENNVENVVNIKENKR